MKFEPKEKITNISQVTFAGSQCVVMFEPASPFRAYAHACALRNLYNSVFWALVCREHGSKGDNLNCLLAP